MATAVRLNNTIRAFIERQPMFFVATAGAEGRVNMSPKGMDSLRVLGEHRIVWLNITGSGNETAAHVLENGRMTLMFCAYEGDAMIVRAYGKARVIHERDDDWDELSGLFGAMPGRRQMFDLTVDLVQASCGFGVPFMDYKGQRGEQELLTYFEGKDREELEAYWRRKNLVSLDGKPTGLFE